MKIMILALFLAFPAVADEINCTAKVTNRAYTVQLDTATKFLSIKNDLGGHFEGMSHYNFSPALASPQYYLSLGFAKGLLVEVETTGAQRVALCLKANECYLCRRD